MVTFLCTDRGPDQVFRLEDEVRAAGAAYRFGEIDTEKRKKTGQCAGIAEERLGRVSRLRC